ncbi:MAG: hypothetical protein GY937_07015 [bacterium]|nr:hypothetical protein [bacterium]
MSRSEYLQTALSVTAILVACGIGYCTDQAAEEAQKTANAALTATERQMKTHLHPDLRCVLKKVDGQGDAMEFVAKNVGDLAATNISVDHSLHFEIEGMLPPPGTGLRPIRRPRPGEKPDVFGLTTISIFDARHNPAGERWLFSSLLEPNEFVSKVTNQFSGSGIRVLWFEVSFFRQSDGNAYTRRCVYYRDTNKKWYEEAKFRWHPKFERLNGALEKSIAERGHTIPDAIHPSEVD